MAPPPSHLQSLLPCDSCLKLNRVDDGEGRVSIIATAVSATAQCPACHRSSSRIHSRYSRRLRDLPWHGSAVELEMEVRRFRCPRRDCPRRTFVERLPTVMATYARQTARLSETIRLIGYMLGGEPGARLAARLGMETSPDTVLRRIKCSPVPTPAESPEVLGVDDWAWRKGQRYGTILVDLERRVPIDLLPDRSAKELQTWLQVNPGVRIISRDRAGTYAEAASKGAPEATQVADRFHLLCNLTAAIERSLEPMRAQLRNGTTDAGEPSPPPAPAVSPKQSPHPTRAQELKDASRQRRLERYNEVVKLHAQGRSQSEISRSLNLQRKTVRRFLRAGHFPERAAPHRRPARVTAFRDFLQQRWGEGCHNATQLWHEIQSRGYEGSRCMVANLVARWRGSSNEDTRTPTSRTKYSHLSPRQAALLLARREEDLDEGQRRVVTKLTTASPEMATLHGLAHDFSQLLRSRREDDFATWITQALASGVPEIKRFCDGLLRDEAAIRAAIRLPWSNGQVEGQVHRLKLIKRQMYGRAGFLLLKRRVLPLWSRRTAALAGRSP